MTKIANTTAYKIKSPLSLDDYFIGTNGEQNANGLVNLQTINGKLSDLRALVLAGLTPTEGGTLKITEIEIDTLNTDIATTVNAISPAYTVLAYEIVFFNVDGQIYVLKSTDVSIGTGQTALTNDDFISIPTSSGQNGLNADMTRTSTDNISIGNSGSKTLTYTSSSNLGWSVGTRLRFSNSVSNYIEGVITAVSATSVTITADNSSGTGSFSSWTISIAGDKGSTGATGSSGSNGTNGTNGLNADMTRTSTTSIVIASSGSKTLNYTASSNLGWTIGTRLRFANSLSNYMEGTVTAVSTTSVTITVDNAKGSGTLASWTISVAGDKGADGSTTNLQKTITVNPTNYPTFTYVLSSADNGYSIYIDIEDLDGGDAFNIEVPTGLPSKFICGFVEMSNLGDVFFVEDGTTINNPVGLVMKGQHYAVCLEQRDATDTFWLLGDTKAS